MSNVTSWFILFLELTEGPKPLANTASFISSSLVHLCLNSLGTQNMSIVRRGLTLCTGFFLRWRSPYMVQLEHISFRVRIQITSPHFKKDSPEQLSSCFLC